LRVAPSHAEGTRLRAPLLALALLLLPAGPARAALTCTATVTGGIVFGTYDVFAPAPLTSTGRIRLNCPKGLTAQIFLSAGNSADFTWRELRSPDGALRYNVYQDPGWSVVWGDGSDGSSVYVSTGGNAQLVLYGRIPAGQDVPDGTYSDALTLTLFF
jgi:spore coat protein U-like protein